jgi:hypothetical protein
VDQSATRVTSSEHEPRLFGSAGRAKEFLIGNLLWFGGFLMIILVVPDDRSDGLLVAGDGPARGSAGPWALLSFAPVVVGIVLIERGVLALHRSGGGVGWLPGFWPRLRALAPATYRAAARESGLPPTVVVVGIYLLIAGTLLSGALRSS